MHTRNVWRFCRWRDIDTKMGPERFGCTHVTFGDLTEYAKELGINGIVSGPDRWKPSGRTQAAFGESTGFKD